MFAPKVAKPQIKAAESSTLVRGRSAAFARPFGVWARDRLAYGQETVGVWAREAGGDHEREAEPTLDREAPRRLDWSLSGISILSPDAPPPVLPLSGLPARTLQPKLAIGSVDDPLEREADRVADHVMRMPDSALSISPGSPQLSRKCAECEEEDKKRLQMKSTAVPQAAGVEAPPILHEVLRQPGQPLDAATRAFFKPRFGYDFSRVRVHTDIRAAASADSIAARATPARRFWAWRMWARNTCRPPSSMELPDPPVVKQIIKKGRADDRLVKRNGLLPLHRPDRAVDLLQGM
jgi:hypothetical protein